MTDAEWIEQKVDQLARRLRTFVDLLAPPESAISTTHVDMLLNGAVALYEPIAHLRGVKLRLMQSLLIDEWVEGAVLFALVTSLLSMAVNEVNPETIIELSVRWAETRDADFPEARAVRFEIVVPGFPVIDPRTLERFDTDGSAGSADANRIEVLGVCLGLARNAGGQRDDPVKLLTKFSSTSQHADHLIAARMWRPRGGGIGLGQPPRPQPPQVVT